MLLHELELVLDVCPAAAQARVRGKRLDEDHRRAWLAAGVDARPSETVEATYEPATTGGEPLAVDADPLDEEGAEQFVLGLRMLLALPRDWLGHPQRITRGPGEVSRT